MCCPKLPGCFNPREVVYRQMKLIRTETVERMNEVLEGVFVDFVDIAGDSWTTNTHSLCCDGSWDKQ